MVFYDNFSATDLVLAVDWTVLKCIRLHHWQPLGCGCFAYCLATGSSSPGTNIMAVWLTVRRGIYGYMGCMDIYIDIWVIWVIC